MQPVRDRQTVPCGGVGPLRPRDHNCGTSPTTRSVPSARTISFISNSSHAKTAGNAMTTSSSTSTTPSAPETIQPGLNRAFLAAKFEAGLSWDDYLATGKPAQQDAWREIYEQVTLSDSQRKLLADFAREMHIICISGIWCGDCVQQGPLLQRIAEACDNIQLVWLDRDQHKDLSSLIHINQGARVPTVLFLAEDDEFVGLYGDRTLTRYRAMADAQLGPSCPLPGAPIPTDQLLATLQDWLDEVERVQLLLRLSPRLRQKHGD